MHEHPGTKLSLGKFYKMSQELQESSEDDGYVPSMRCRTEGGETIAMHPVPFGQRGPTITLEAQVKYYRHHIYFKEQQQEQGYYRDAVNRTSPSSCVVVMD